MRVCVGGASARLAASMAYAATKPHLDVWVTPALVLEESARCVIAAVGDNLQLLIGPLVQVSRAKGVDKGWVGG